MERVPDEQDSRYEAAKKRVEEIRGFYIHLGVYLVFAVAMFAINEIATPDRFWWHWPVLIWGVGFAMHAFAVVTENRLFGPEWEERKVRKLLRRDQGPRIP
jgi:hypothetical protein